MGNSDKIKKFNDLVLKQEIMLNAYKEYLLEKGLNPELVNGIPNEQEDVEKCFTFFKNQIGENGGKLITPSPLEVHPYLKKYPIDISRKKLIIGTFPPISYVSDYLENEGYPIGNINRPKAPFFYGNQLSLWECCADEALNKSLQDFRSEIIDRSKLLEEISNYLKRNSLSVSDIISSCQRELVDCEFTAKDKNLWNIKLNISLIEILLEDNELEELIFTSSGANGEAGILVRLHEGESLNNFGLVDISNRDALSLFLRACQINNTRIDIAGPIPRKTLNELSWITINHENREQINSCFKGRLFFYMRLYKNKEIYKDLIVNTPPSPSGDARRGLTNSYIYRFITNRKDEFVRSPQIKMSVDEYKRIVYVKMLNGDNHHYLLNLLNADNLPSEELVDSFLQFDI